MKVKVKTVDHSKPETLHGWFSLSPLEIKRLKEVWDSHTHIGALEPLAINTTPMGVIDFNNPIIC